MQSLQKNSHNICGGHVRKLDGNFNIIPGLYIIPICTECNNPYNREAFSVDENDLVRVG